MKFRSNVTNKIVTDREITKALECCSSDHTMCVDCPYATSILPNRCSKALMVDLHTLIRRQRERIEALEFLQGHDMLAAIGQLEELKQFYGSSDISIGLTIAIDTIKKGVVSQP